MKECTVPIFLAYVSALYIGATIIYTLFKHKSGRPFYNSLTKEQLSIKSKSAGKRARLFCIGIIVTGIALFVFKPFKKCRSKTNN